MLPNRVRLNVEPDVLALVLTCRKNLTESPKHLVRPPPRHPQTDSRQSHVIFSRSERSCAIFFAENRALERSWLSFPLKKSSETPKPIRERRCDPARRKTAKKQDRCRPSRCVSEITYSSLLYRRGQRSFPRRRSLHVSRDRVELRHEVASASSLLHSFFVWCSSTGLRTARRLDVCLSLGTSWGSRCFD